MPITNGQAVPARNRNHRLFSFPLDEMRRRDSLMRTAFMSIVAPFKCRPDPRGPWDETATGDQTPYEQPLSLARSAMAAAIVLGDREKIDGVMGGVSAFCREFEADIASMLPAREEESIVAVALDETHAEGEANQVEAELIANPTPTNADRAVRALERQHDRIGKLVRMCRKAARANTTALALVVPVEPMNWALAGRMTVWTILILAGMLGAAVLIGRRLQQIGYDYPEISEDEEQDYEEGTQPPRTAA